MNELVNKYMSKYWDGNDLDCILPKSLKLKFPINDEFCPKCNSLMQFNNQVIGRDYSNNEVVISDDYSCLHCDENFYIELEFYKYIDKHQLDLT